MAESKEQRLAKDIYAQIGGIANVSSLTNCMTRVRITLRDDSQVDKEQLEAIDGVMGVVEENELQVVVGPGIAGKVAGIMAEQAGVELGEEISDDNAAANDIGGETDESDREKVESKAKEMKAESKAKRDKDSRFKRLLKTIANIFIPLIPAFVGAGIVGGIASVLANLQEAGDISDSWQGIITTLTVIQSGLYAYLPIFVGINAARQFGATPGLGGVIGAVTMLSGMDPEEPLINIFNGDALASGQGGIIGVIFAVWILSMVEKRVRKIIPNSLDIIVTPTITLLLVGLFTIFIVMPAAGLVSSSLVGAITWVLDIGGAFAGFVLGLFFLPMVMFGLHQILTPIHIEMINSSGFTPLLPILAMAGAGQVGAAFAIWVKCHKNKRITRLVKGALPVGILGIGEPLIYGVTLPLGRPFITACIGGGIGGAVVASIGTIGATAIGPSGLSLIPLIANGKWLSYIIGLCAGYLGGFVATYFFGVPKDIQEEVTED
ncbi:PTS transporter subunit EIIC [Barrientosiimonas marina]|uniref:PTS transporter subunit EIIC n=1 Tax=Lentibacillus kimchii TaxID=1542911 RepID=A0ABW2UX52_9BACI